MSKKIINMLVVTLDDYCKGAVGLAFAGAELSRPRGARANRILGVGNPIAHPWK